jgi:hypothetical protein
MRRLAIARFPFLDAVYDRSPPVSDVHGRVTAIPVALASDLAVRSRSPAASNGEHGASVAPRRLHGVC